MGWIIFSVLFILVAIFVPKFLKDRTYSGDRKLDERGYPVTENGQPVYETETVSLALWRWGVRIVALLIGILLLLPTSFVIVESDEVGHLKRIYMAGDMPSGRILAAPGQKGPQAEIIPPGST